MSADECAVSTVVWCYVSESMGYMWCDISGCEHGGLQCIYGHDMVIHDTCLWCEHTSVHQKCGAIKLVGAEAPEGHQESGRLLRQDHKATW